tara:strand:+ start:1988 stop:2446 length:459 start_codon:yes stop_codon:yes gene_type:complete
MSGLDVVSVQDSIEAYVKEQFSNYAVYDSDVFDDNAVIKVANKIKPYIVLRWGGLRNSNTGGGFGGVRHDEYYSTVDVAVVSPTSKQSRIALNIIVDKLVGWKPAGSNHMKSEGGMDIIGIAIYDAKPTAYLASSRLRYAINATDVAAYITP